MYLLVIAGALALWLLVSAVRRRAGRLHFPGPPQWPLVGNLLQFGPRDKIHLRLQEWARRYGSVFKVDLLGDPVLVVADAQLQHELLVTRGGEFSGRPRYLELLLFSGNGQDIVFSQPDARWRGLRKLAHSSLRMYDRGLERIEAVSMELVRDMLEGLKRAGGPGGGELIDPKPFLYTATMNIIASLLVGRVYTENSEYYDCYQGLEKTTLDLGSRRLSGCIMGALPWLRHVCDLLRDPLARYEEANARMYALVREEARKSEEDGFTDGLASVLGRAVQRGEIPEDHIRYAIADVILGGSLTTTTTMYGLLHVLAHQPEVQARLHAEIDAVLGARPVSLDDRQRLHYCAATILETLRYTVVLPLGVFHSTPGPTTVAGRLVPAGTTVMFSLYTMNHDPVNFPEPGVFRPERFLDEAGVLVRADHPARRSMSAFGAGVRVCLGESLAKGRLFLIVVSLLQRFTIVADPADPAASSHISAFRQNGVLMTPDYKASFIPR